MSTYVLIHGAYLGAWCWKKIIPLLEKEGHKVVAPDLPGHGENKRPIAEITLQTYTDHLCEILDEQPDPVILVGHSLGGVVITQTAEYRPEKIRKLVYVAGYLLRNGEFQYQHIKSSGMESVFIPGHVGSGGLGYHAYIHVPHSQSDSAASSVSLSDGFPYCRMYLPEAWPAIF